MKSLEPASKSIYKPDILIIDDDQTIARIMTMVLERAGYAVRSATSARAGLNEALRKTPDAILLDYMLPERSGLELLADFRQSMDLMDTPVIMLTASKEVSVVKNAIVGGVNDYLLKPVDPETLLDRLTRLLGSRAPSKSGEEAGVESSTASMAKPLPNANPAADETPLTETDPAADETPLTDPEAEPE